MKLQDYRRRLGWSQAELARRAKLNANTVRKAENSEPVSSATAVAIVEALAQALREQILVEDIDNLKVIL
ncbi:MAG: helix-turn-helix transcriptional regulator [Ktedonobacteraceae bacterium]|nr:helix-turn-helix transcriptional regulator [Ktedonobacteraceae bacterium]